VVIDHSFLFTPRCHVVRQHGVNSNKTKKRKSAIGLKTFRQGSSQSFHTIFRLVLFEGVTAKLNSTD